MTRSAMTNSAARVFSQSDVEATIDVARSFRREDFSPQFAATALPEVIECMSGLSGVSPDAVAELAMTVGALRALPKLSVPSLIQVLNYHYESCPQVVIAVANALREFGAEAKAAVSPLRRAMACLSDYADVLVAVSNAIIAIDPSQAKDCFVAECSVVGARELAERDRRMAELEELVGEGLVIETALPLPPHLQKFQRRNGGPAHEAN